ncbi:MAG TPA: DUF4258 domain-containing protein [Candidatus Brocadiia bacterium]|nr:DUF4258 domain-containing protein [Candidatus Brocadiales bacterium]
MTPINWIWTDHIEMQLIERKIPKESVKTAIDNPDEIVRGKHARTIYQKQIGNKLIRVVTENNKLITVYLTDKVKKYIKGEGK